MPAPHVTQLACPALVCAEPRAQVVHVAAAAAEYKPGVQAAHTVDAETPVTEEYEPALQPMQVANAVAPVTDEYNPALQLAHFVAPVTA